MHGIQPKLLPSFAVALDNAKKPNSGVEKETKSTRGILDVLFLFVRPRGFVRWQLPSFRRYCVPVNYLKNSIRV